MAVHSATDWRSRVLAGAAALAGSGAEAGASRALIRSLLGSSPRCRLACSSHWLLLHLLPLRYSRLRSLLQIFEKLLHPEDTLLSEISVLVNNIQFAYLDLVHRLQGGCGQILTFVFGTKLLTLCVCRQLRALQLVAS